MLVVIVYYSLGESVPTTKTPLPSNDKQYNPTDHKRHTLFAGTHIIQSCYYGKALVLAVVVRTGFLTAKGGMVRSILFPKPLNMKFYWDSIKYILILSVLGGGAVVYTILIHRIGGNHVSSNDKIYDSINYCYYMYLVYTV